MQCLLKLFCFISNIVFFVIFLFVDLMEQIRDLQIFVHTVKLEVKSKAQKKISNNAKEKFQKEFNNKLTAFKTTQSAAVAEV